MIQVKTTDAPKPQWVVSVPPAAGDALVYVFVNLAPDYTAAPAFHVVPSKAVKSAALKEKKFRERKYLEKNGVPFDPEGVKKGMLHFTDEPHAYLDSWEHLGLAL
jgi:hypothetical protein